MINSQQIFLMKVAHSPQGANLKPKAHMDLAWDHKPIGNMQKWYMELIILIQSQIPLVKMFKAIIILKKG